MLARHAQVHKKGIVQNASVRVNKTEVVALVGANGSGKSTFLRGAAGLEEFVGGQLSVESPTSLLFQNPEHQVVMPSVAADVALGAPPNLDRHSLNSRVSDCLDAVNLSGMETRRVSTLSGGQKQRLALAGALARDPAVILCDEITSFLDSEDASLVMRCVRGAASRGAACLWATHRLEEALSCDSAVAFRQNGCTIEGLDNVAPTQAVDAVRSTSAHH
jgi:energy-coupling factor transport system ATP-binding protein